MAKGIATRERIIQESAELFNKVGYHACSLNDIMKATNLKKGGIYNHFQNKDEIALEAFDFNFKNILKAFRKRLDTNITPTEKINSIIEVYSHLTNVPGFESGCPIFNTAVNASNSHPALKEKAIAAINQMKKYIEIKINEGIATGEFKADADKVAIPAMIIMTIEGALIMNRVSSGMSIEVAIDGLKTYLKEKLFI